MYTYSGTIFLSGKYKRRLNEQIKCIKVSTVWFWTDDFKRFQVRIYTNLTRVIRFYYHHTHHEFIIFVFMKTIRCFVISCNVIMTFQNLPGNILYPKIDLAFHHDKSTSLLPFLVSSAYPIQTSSWNSILEVIRGYLFSIIMEIKIWIPNHHDDLVIVQRLKIASSAEINFFKDLIKITTDVCLWIIVANNTQSIQILELWLPW